MTEEKCHIRFKSDDILGWKLELSGNCNDVMAKIDQLPDNKKGYLKRRTDYKSESSSI